MGTEETEGKKGVEEESSKQEQEEVEEQSVGKAQEVANGVLASAFGGAELADIDSGEEDNDGNDDEDGGTEKKGDGGAGGNDKGKDQDGSDDEKQAAEEEDKDVGEEKELDPKVQERLDAADKRLKDTQVWANDVNQKQIETERELKKTKLELEAEKAKANDTFDAEAHQKKVDAINAAGKLDPKIGARAELSKKAAIKAYGQDKIDRLIGKFGDDTPYQKAILVDPSIARRVLESELPYFEAMKVVEDLERSAKFGNSPEEMLKNIREQFEKDEKPKLIEEIKKGLSGGNGKLNNLPRGLPTGGGGISPTDGKKKQKVTTGKGQLDAVFPNTR
jgi:hypothetical protein